MIRTKAGTEAVVVNDKGEILLTQRQDLHSWSFPGGGMSEGETAETAVEREIFEETGIKAKIERLRAIIIFDHWLMRWVHLIFLGKEMGGEEKRQVGEVLAIKWVSKEKVLEHLDDFHKLYINIAFSKERKTRVVYFQKLPFPMYKLPIYLWRRGLGKKFGLVKV